MRSKKGRSGVWVDIAVVAAIVGTGVVVAGITGTSSSTDLAIPGCEEVIQEEDLMRINYAFTTGAEVARADEPWITDSKLNGMTEALVGALPAGTVVEPDSVTSRLEFSGDRETYSVAGSTADAGASGTITSDGRTGLLDVIVGRADQPPGPCFVGTVDERVTSQDGAVFDVQDRGDTRRVVAITPDETRIEVTSVGVMTIDQLTDIASAPGLRIDAPGR
ncbi:hypothetical protein CH289_10820 [Rhodococcus sp. RS1C4]|nr:hypothetical protein [Rhodococcus sp. RS1C4]OZC52779.1 hypothetical protein CH289_10820 [Rhodococcus sp. RS1C4]